MEYPAFDLTTNYLHQEGRPRSVISLAQSPNRHTTLQAKVETCPYVVREHGSRAFLTCTTSRGAESLEVDKPAQALLRNSGDGGLYSTLPTICGEVDPVA
jgi:hypothetical protein